MASGQPVYNTDQRRQILRQIKQYFDKEWLNKRAKGTLSKRKITLPNAKKQKRLRKKPLRLFKIKIKKRRKRRYYGRYFKRSNRRFL